MRKPHVVLGLLTALSIRATAQSVTIQSTVNYRGWGWESVVMENGLVTAATVPAIGARVMQYDLGSHASLFVNPAETGKTYKPAQGASWHNFGGFKNWPAPQDEWGWPPPPTLDFGAYTASIVSQTADSVALLVTGPTEKWLAPGIHFERRAVLYPGSTRLKMEQTLVNDGSIPVEWSVWDITQCIVNHPGERDFENFWVYFPKNPNSVFGVRGVRWDKTSTAWRGEIAPGVYGVQFLPENKKIFADSHKGWIAYADQRHGVVYAKTYSLFEGEYPDGGAHNEVWINCDPLYLEVEVVGPIVQIPSGTSNHTTFTIDWWAATMRSPVLDVNGVGAIAQPLALDRAASFVSGVFGCFHQGTAKVEFLDGGDQVLSEGASHSVTPLAEFVLEETLDVPAGAERFRVSVADGMGRTIGVLDGGSLSERTGISNRLTTARPSGFSLEQNYPNPFNGGTTLCITVLSPMRGNLSVFNVRG